MAGCCTHGLVFKDHASFPRIPFRKCLLEIVRYICRILGECPVAVLMCWCQDIECQRCAFGNNKFQPMRSPKIQKKEVKFAKRTQAPKLKFFMTPPSFSSRQTWTALSSCKDTVRNSRFLLKPAGELIEYPFSVAGAQDSKVTGVITLIA